MNQEDFTANVASMKAMADSVTRTAKEHLKTIQEDTESPLSLRWSRFLMLCPFLPTRNCYSYALDAFVGNFNLYDDLYLERYEDISWSDFEARVHEMMDFDQPRWATQENWDKVREAAIKEGYGGFKNDW